MHFRLKSNTPVKTTTVAAKNRKIGTCMTHRSDIVWINATDSKQQILEKIGTYKQFNYFPVCAENIDTVIGILTVRDYLSACISTPSPSLSTTLTEPFFIPESISIQQALNLLKEYKSNTACVIDEYGGIEGFITKNGLLSILLNENTETDTAEKIIFQQADGGILVSGQISLDTLQSVHFLKSVERSEKEDYYTLAGYLLTLTDTIPHSGETITTENYLYKITKMNGQRIEQVWIKEKK